MPTKRNLITLALEEIGFGANKYSPDQEDLDNALTRLDALMGEYDASGALTSWPFGTGLDAETGLSPAYVRGVIAGLAVDLAAGFGVDPSPRTLTAAQQGRALMFKRSAVVPSKVGDPLAIPAGQGHKRRYVRNLPQYDPNIYPDERGDT